MRSALVVLAALLLAGCGSSTGPAPGDESPSGQAVKIVDPDQELVAHGILMQSSPDAPVEICVGGVAESLPPQCSGPVLLGDFSWEDVGPERASGVTWTDEPWYAVGDFDPDGGPQGSITLTRPVSGDPPEGYAVPTAAEEVTFPQLCDDPFRGGSEDAAGDVDAQEQLAVALEDLDGYVTSWVSDGSSLFNVLVTGDPEEAFEELREVWRGGLCVEQRDLPTQEELLAAQDALVEEWEELRLLHAGAGGMTGMLEVGVLVSDQETVDAVLETVSPWLEPDQVVITGALRPLDG